jgi:hypothetical protein
MTIYLPIPVPNKIEYNINIPYSPTNGTMIVVPPATINAILFHQVGITVRGGTRYLQPLKMVFCIS